MILLSGGIAVCRARLKVYICRFQLEGALLCNTDVICLCLGQTSHHTTKALDHQFRHLFVQFFWQHFDADGLALIFILLAQPCSNRYICAST